MKKELQKRIALLELRAERLCVRLNMFDPKCRGAVRVRNSLLQILSEMRACKESAQTDR